jgi:hypothetical protein
MLEWGINICSKITPEKVHDRFANASLINKLVSLVKLELTFLTLATSSHIKNKSFLLYTSTIKTGNLTQVKRNLVFLLGLKTKLHLMPRSSKKNLMYFISKKLTPLKIKKKLFVLTDSTLIIKNTKPQRINLYLSHYSKYHHYTRAFLLYIATPHAFPLQTQSLVLQQLRQPGTLLGKNHNKCI